MSETKHPAGPSGNEAPELQVSQVPEIRLSVGTNSPASNGTTPSGTIVPSTSSQAGTVGTSPPSNRDSEQQSKLGTVRSASSQLDSEFPEGDQGLVFDKPGLQAYARISLTLMLVPLAVLAAAVKHAGYRTFGGRPADPSLRLAVQRSAYRAVSTRLSPLDLRILMGLRPVRKELEPYSSRAQQLGLNHFNKQVKLKRKRRLSNSGSVNETRLGPRLTRCITTATALSASSGVTIARSGRYSARWLHEMPNRNPEDVVIIYFHGGGYGLKISSPQIKYLMELVPRFAQVRASTIVLDYTVTPYARFPAQLIEAVRLVNDLAASGCTRIALLGDSCGANLALALLQQIKYPLATVPRLNVSVSSFVAVALCSPWCALESSRGGDSFLQNQHKDITDGPSLDKMCEMFAQESDLYNPLCQPNAANCLPGYWRGVLPENTLAIWAENEVLRDSCRAWARDAHVKHCFEEPLGVHDCMLGDWDSPSTAFLLERMIPWLQDQPGPDPVQLPQLSSINALFDPNETDHGSPVQSPSKSKFSQHLAVPAH